MNLITTTGLPTGIQSFDEKLPWKGLPQKGLSAFVGPKGSGRTKLWASCFARLNRWGAWIESNPELYPPALMEMGGKLDQLLIVHPPHEKKMWTLSQAIATHLFTLIGCEVNGNVRSGDIEKLAYQCRGGDCSVVLFFEKIPPVFPHWHFKLHLNFENKDVLTIERAKNIPTPLVVRLYYENTNTGNSCAALLNSSA